MCGTLAAAWLTLTPVSPLLAQAPAATPAPAPAQTARGGADADQLVTADELKARVGKLVDGRAFSALRSGGNYMVMTAVRAVPGEPEVHEGMADLFIIQEGSAQITLGGRLAGGRNTIPGEWLGGSISGGQTRKVAAGDILWIPPGWPHQVTPTSPGGLRYLVVKVAGPSAVPPPTPAKPTAP